MDRYSVQVRLESQKGDFPGINIPNHCDHTIQAKIMVALPTLWQSNFNY